MKSNQHWNNAMKSNQQGRQSFVSISRYGLLFKILEFLRRQTMMAKIFQGFFARWHWISSLNPNIGRGHEIIIAFREDSIGQNIGLGAWWQRGHVTLWNWTAGTSLGKESSAHFLSVAGNVITTWSYPFDKLQ